MTSLNNETAPEGTEVVRLVAGPTKQLGHGEGLNLPTTVFVDAVLTQAGKIWSQIEDETSLSPMELRRVRKPALRMTAY